MSHWEDFDYVVINDDLETAVADLEAVFAGQGAPSATDNEALSASPLKASSPK